MKKIKKMPIIIMGTIITLTTTIFATTGKVNAPSGLVLRDEPSKNGSPITTVKDDANVEIVEKSGEWYKVKYNGQEGYLFAQYVENIDTTNQAENPDNNQINQTNGEIKLYKMPLITSTPIGTIAQGASVTVLKEITNWSYITDGTNEGWIRTYLVKGEQMPQGDNPSQEQPETPQEPETPSEPQKPEEQTTNEPTTSENNNQETSVTATKGVVDVSAANVRKEASKNSAIVTTLTKDTDVTINAETDEWYKITYTDTNGTVYEGYMLKTLIKTN